MTREKSTQLKILLLKEIDSFEEALKEPGSLNVYDLAPGTPYEGTIYTSRSHVKPPSWLKFLQTGVTDPISHLNTATAAGILFVEAGGRKFAFTFGYGRNLLVADCFERDFGLRVVLNTVDPESVRSLDIKTVEELTLVTKRQASRASTFNTFGLDVNKDLLYAITGRPKDENFAKRIAGSDALTISLPIEFSQLADKCIELLEAYHSQNYKEDFSFIDHLRPIKDKSRIEQLQDRLIEDIEDADFEKMHLAPPEAIDWENVTGFKYSEARRAETYLDLDIEEMLAELHTSSTDLTINRLKQRHVYAVYREADNPIAKWTIYLCMVYETEIEDQLYVLSGGDWFEVNKSFAQQVKNSVAALPTSGLSFPSASLGQYEGDYNEAVAGTQGYALMDEQLIRYGGPRDQIELCDLLTPSRKFVHVKRKTRSSTLSHLFSQGLNAAELFLYESEFRNKAQQAVSQVDPSLGHLIPVGRPTPDDYEVAYAIITKPRADWPNSLPFFSQLSLRNAAERLQRLGFRVSLTMIEQQ